METHGRMAELARNLRKVALIGGSDASVVQKRRTAAWMIATHNDLDTNIQGKGPVDSNPTTIYSVRAERGAAIGCQ